MSSSGLYAFSMCFHGVCNLSILLGARVNRGYSRVFMLFPTNFLVFSPLEKLYPNVSSYHMELINLLKELSL